MRQHARHRCAPPVNNKLEPRMRTVPAVEMLYYFIINTTTTTESDVTKDRLPAACNSRICSHATICACVRRAVGPLFVCRDVIAHIECHTLTATSSNPSPQNTHGRRGWPACIRTSRASVSGAHLACGRVRQDTSVAAFLCARLQLVRNAMRVRVREACSYPGY